MEGISFDNVADVLEDIENNIQRCYQALNASRDEKRQQLGESMHCLKQDCEKLETELRNLEQLKCYLMESYGGYNKRVCCCNDKKFNEI